MVTMGYVKDHDKLRSLEPGEFDIVIVHNVSPTPSTTFTPVPDSGLFFWKKDSKDEDDNVTTITPITPSPKPPLDKGRWKREFDGPISVKRFGAKGDYDPTHDKKDDGDTKALQQAFNVALRTGVALYLPPGKYKITSTLHYDSNNLDSNGEEDPLRKIPGQESQQGLYLFGAGMQKSVIYNRIGSIDPKVGEGGPAISIGRTSTDNRTFQQGGKIMDLKITTNDQSDVPIKNSSGIWMRSAWAYTIQNVCIWKMGSHGIVIKNDSFDQIPNSSDLDSSAHIHLDYLVSDANGGWGILVDAEIHNSSTSYLHIENCRILNNRLGGIQLTGILGVVERCAIIGNGTNKEIPENLKKIPPQPYVPPTPVDNAYGILVKNVRAVIFGFRIEGCQIQGNSRVQVMIDDAINTKILHNEFAADDLDIRNCFPSVDIQVGDDNLGDTTTDFKKVFEKLPIKVKKTYQKNISMGGSITLTNTDYNEKFIEFIGTSVKKDVTIIFPSSIVDKSDWLIINSTDATIKLKVEMGPEISIASGYEKAIFKDNKTLSPYTPRYIYGCVIEDNYFRYGWAANWGKKVLTPDGKQAPMPSHTVVKVNSNAIGTIIKNWYWVGGFPPIDKDNKNEYKFFDLVETSFFTGKRFPVISYGNTHFQTNLHTNEVNGGNVLLPFASVQNTLNLQKEEFQPDTSRWSSFRLRLMDDLMLLIMKNPTTRKQSGLTLLGIRERS